MISRVLDGDRRTIAIALCSPGSNQSAMDRAAFLRSLPYLRPVLPSTWGQITSEPISSCSTTTPPTPRSEHDSVFVLEDVAVSIEPVYKGKSRKRGRDVETEGKVAFFHCKTEDIKEPPIIVNTAKTNKGNEKESEPAHNEINNDPALCSFELAIVKRRYMIPHSQKKELTTPNATGTMDTGEADDLDANVLLVRFGNYFVFEIDASAIVRVNHHDGRTDAERDDCANLQENGAEKDDSAHRAKRQRTEDGKQSTSIEEVKCPPSLCISFPSCTFRVFSLVHTGTNDNHLSNALSKITRHVDIDNSDATTWAACALDKLEYEEWSTCLYPNLLPQKKASPTKTDSSSTHFEKGQKSSDPKVTGDDDSEGDHGGTENSDTQPIDIIGTKASQQKSSQKSTISEIFNGLVGSKSQASGTKSEAEPENSSDHMQEISAKRHHFDNSWSQIQESARNSNSHALLTSCAQSLERSYCNPSQHATFSEQCDLDIETTTGEVETWLEEMMPSRGRAGSRVSTPSRLSSDGGTVDHEQRINDLLMKRKEAVAAKYALFLVPKN